MSGASCKQSQTGRRSIAEAWLADREQFNIKVERGIGWDNATSATTAIAEVTGDNELAFVTDAHPGHTLIPATDNLARSQGKLKGLIAWAGAIKDTAPLKPAGIVNTDLITGLGGWSAATGMVYKT